MARAKRSTSSSRTQPAPGTRSRARRASEASSPGRPETARPKTKRPVARREDAPEVLTPVEIRREQAPDAALPSSLGLERHASAARSGRAVLEERVSSHHETGPAMTGGDLDADWVAAYSVGDETPGGDNPTPDQDVVDEIGKALGVEYDIEEELDGDRVVERDRHRWELDPASSEDYQERVKAVPKPRGKEGGEGA